MDRNNIYLIMFMCLISISLFIISDSAPKELILLPVLPLLICTCLLGYDDWHNDSGAVG